MMKLVKQLFLVMAIVVGVSITASAQSNDNKKDPPPKKDPPVIVVKPDKNQPKEDKKDDKKDDKKKPETAFYSVSESIHISFV